MFTPGSIASAGPVDIGPSLMSTTGASAGKIHEEGPGSSVASADSIAALLLTDAYESLQIY